MIDIIRYIIVLKCIFVEIVNGKDKHFKKCGWALKSQIPTWLRVIGFTLDNINYILLITFFFRFLQS